jgi:hypothetical protein
MLFVYEISMTRTCLINWLAGLYIFLTHSISFHDPDITPFCLFVGESGSNHILGQPPDLVRFHLKGNLSQERKPALTAS